MWNPELIDTTQILYRQIPAVQRVSAEGIPYKFPSPDHFSLRPDINEDSLSFNWEKYANVNQLFTLLGLRKGDNGDYIKPENYVMFQYPVSILVDILGFDKIVHDPDFNGNPSDDGMPNNPSHALLYCGDFKIGTRVELSKYCQKNESSKVDFKIKSIRKSIEELRARKNDTPYHKDWNFDETELINEISGKEISSDVIVAENATKPDIRGYSDSNNS